MAARTKHHCLCGLKGTGPCLSSKVSSRAAETGRRDVRPATLQNVFYAPRYSGRQPNEPLAAPWVPNAFPAIIHGTRLPVDLPTRSQAQSSPRTRSQAKSLGERCLNFRSSSPHQPDKIGAISGTFFSSHGVHFILSSALDQQVAPVSAFDQVNDSNANPVHLTRRGRSSWRLRRIKRRSISAECPSSPGHQEGS